MSKCVHAVWIWHRVLRVSGDGCGLGGGGPRRLRHLLAGVQNRGDVRTAAEDAEQLVSEKHAHSQRLMESTARKDAYCFAQLIQPHGVVDVLRFSVSLWCSDACSDVSSADTSAESAGTDGFRACTSTMRANASTSIRGLGWHC